MSSNCRQGLFIHTRNGRHLWRMSEVIEKLPQLEAWRVDRWLAITQINGDVRLDVLWRFITETFFLHPKFSLWPSHSSECVMRNIVFFVFKVLRSVPKRAVPKLFSIFSFIQEINVSFPSWQCLPRESLPPPAPEGNFKLYYNSWTTFHNSWTKFSHIL